MFHIDVNTFNIYKYSVCISCIPRHSRVKSFGDSSAKAATVCIYKLHHVICLGEGQMETDLTGQVLEEGCGKASPVNLVWTYLIFKSMKIYRLVTVFNVLKHQQG